MYGWPWNGLALLGFLISSVPWGELDSELCLMCLRESHAVILRDRVVPASQVPFPGEPSGEPGNGTWRAGTTLYRRNDSVGFFFSPVTIKLLQRIRTKTSFDQFCIRFIRIYRLLWSSARVRNELLTNHRRDIKTQGEGRWTRQGWIYPMFDVIRHIFTIPLQNQRNSKGEKLKSTHNVIEQISTKKRIQCQCWSAERNNGICTLLLFGTNVQNLGQTNPQIVADKHLETNVPTPMRPTRCEYY